MAIASAPIFLPRMNRLMDVLMTTEPGEFVYLDEYAVEFVTDNESALTLHPEVSSALYEYQERRVDAYCA